MTISEFERITGQSLSTPSQREAAAFLDLLGLCFGHNYTLATCEEWAAALLGHPSDRIRAHIPGAPSRRSPAPHAAEPVPAPLPVKRLPPPPPA